MRPYGGEKRRVKPTSVLITTLQIEIGYAAQFGVALHYGGVTHSRIEPDVQDIFLLGEIPFSTARTT
jgi:hypothetical protein